MKSLPSLLIVDDDREYLKYLEIMLKDIRVNLIVAESGEEALMKIKGINLALAVIDIQMPGISGIELSQKINANRNKQVVPVIFLTANQTDEIKIIEGNESGAIDYLNKPVKKWILLSKINVFLELFRQKQKILESVEKLKKFAVELFKANTALKISEKKYKTMLNASPDSIFLIDLKGIITEVSEIGLELFGASRDDLIGKHFLRLVPSDEKIFIKEIIEKTLNEGLAQNIEIILRKKNQSFFTSETSTTLIQGSDGVPLSFMIIIRDISQRKKLEKQLIHSERMSSLGEMASDIAHEINQPLNTISMVMDNILYEVAKDENIKEGYFKKKSDKIFENIIRIRNIIDHIMVFSRNHDDYLLTGFDINSSIKNATSMISEQFKHLAIDLNLDLEEKIPSIIGNTYKFEQVILNLLVNAKDALLEKKNKQKEYFDMFVGIKSFQENQCIIVEITDNGIGISDEDIDQIVLPFYTTKDTGKGTGLGLSISYQIIKEMQGTIEISSNIFYGTKIKIILGIQNKK